MSELHVLAVSWWCQSTRTPWTWTPKLYIGVWIVMGAILGTYAWSMRRRARSVGLDARDKRAIVWFVLGTLSLWIATDWPLGLLGSGYLLSVHTTLYLIYTMVAAPLMLIGIPQWMARNMLDRLHGWGVYRASAKPWIAAVVLNVALVFTHLPSNVLLILVPFMPTLEFAVALLLVRFSISQMDVPTRQSYTIAVVDPDERSAAAGVTGIARSLGVAAAPLIAGPLYLGSAFIGAPFVIGGDGPADWT